MARPGAGGKVAVGAPEAPRGERAGSVPRRLRCRAPLRRPDQDGAGTETGSTVAGRSDQSGAGGTISTLRTSWV